MSAHPQADPGLPVIEARPAFTQQELTLQTDEALGVYDITSDVEAIAAGAEIPIGFVLVQSLHTTAGVMLNECESGLRRDLRELARRLVPPEAEYVHDDMTVRTENICPEDLEFPNGHSHLQHALFGSASLTLPLVGGSLGLGRWQRVLLVEYDRPRSRRVSVTVLGFCPSPGTA